MSDSELSASTGELGRTIADELRALAEDGSKVHSPGMPEHTLCRGALALLKENERLRGIVPEVLERLNDELCAENERLRAALRQANTQAEYFERQWYLRGDALEVAVRQNEHDMLMTGDELRACRAALAGL